MTREEYAQIAAECKALADEKMKAVAGEGSDVVLFNTLGFARNDLAVLPEGVVNGLEGFAAQEARRQSVQPHSVRTLQRYGQRKNRHCPQKRMLPSPLRKKTAATLWKLRSIPFALMKTA